VHHRGDVEALIRRLAPDVLLVGYWELLDMLPADPGPPVVLDVIAPRLLEARFEARRPPARETRRMLSLFRRADRFLCGSDRQRHLLLALLLMAGFECEPEVPIDVVAISAVDVPGRRRRRGRGPWQIVSGGVDWPWRRSGPYLDAVRAALAVAPIDARLQVLSGPYVYERRPQAPPRRARRSPAAAAAGPRGLLPYAEMEKLFLRSHVGLELAERNLEREYSASFRALEYLRCGVPLMVNDYLELAGHVRTSDAGWVVSSPREVGEALRDLRVPRRWERKSEAAADLAAGRFHYRRTAEPLLAFVRDLRRARRGPPLVPLPAP
ncbi:MAG TPA: glycosyltransferase, partial [Vicinamibacteria bacterium]|nr:glycosyltransferase [Vicinamibacteria bacterium]